MAGIIWLASYPKSGNTWLRVFLHHLFRNATDTYDLNRLDDLTAGDSQTKWYHRLDPRPASQYTIAEVAALRPRVHAMLAESSPDSVFVKTHCAVMEDHGHPTVNMDVTAGAVYVVRNPLDVVLSYADHFGCDLDEAIARMAKPSAITGNSDSNVYEVHGSWTENVESWTGKPNPSLHVVRYEDMLEKAFRSFQGIARFLRLDPPKDRLERAIRLSSFRSLQEKEKAQGFRERSPHSKLFFRSGRSGQWRTVLTKDQIARMVEAHREQMSRFGYLPKGF